MTALTITSLTSPAPAYVDDRYVVVSDPRPGTIVELGAGSRWASGSGAVSGSVGGTSPSSRVTWWRWPSMATSSSSSSSAAGDGSSPLRLERRHPERAVVHEVCEVLVVPVSDPAVRGPVCEEPRSHPDEPLGPAAWSLWATCEWQSSVRPTVAEVRGASATSLEAG